MFRISASYIAGYLHSLFGEVRKLDGVRIFSYHGIVETKTDARLERNFHLLSDLRQHVNFFKKKRCLSLDELHHLLSNQQQLPSNSLVITFDDGYKNNVLAAEILSKAGIPWAIFVSTGSIGAPGTIWTCELALLLLHGTAEKLVALGEIWDLAERAQREAAFQAIRYAMKAMPAEARRAVMEEIRAQYPDGETERLLDLFSGFRMSDWRDLAQLAGSGVEIGSHGVLHEIHHELQPREVRKREMVDSRRSIEAHLGISSRYFAFPNGNTTTTSRRELLDAGYRMGFTTVCGTVIADADPLLLPRIEPSGPIGKIAYRFHWQRR